MVVRQMCPIRVTSDRGIQGRRWLRRLFWIIQAIYQEFRESYSIRRVITLVKSSRGEEISRSFALEMLAASLWRLLISVNAAGPLSNQIRKSLLPARAVPWLWNIEPARSLPLRPVRQGSGQASLRAKCFPGFASLAMMGVFSVDPAEISFAISRGKSVVLIYNSILAGVIP